MNVLHTATSGLSLLGSIQTDPSTGLDLYMIIPIPYQFNKSTSAVIKARTETTVEAIAEASIEACCTYIHQIASIFVKC